MEVTTDLRITGSHLLLISINSGATMMRGGGLATASGGQGRVLMRRRQENVMLQKKSGTIFNLQIILMMKNTGISIR